MTKKSLKKYYYAHELAYDSYKRRGIISWGGAKSLKEYENFSYRKFLIKEIRKYFSTKSLTSFDKLHALEVGCGTGPGASLLNSLGFIVTGVDICQTAIDLAKELNRKKEHLHFEVADICQYKSKQKFDLIVDGHLLHCLIAKSDRRRALLNIKRALKSDGIFLVSTMTYTGDDKKLGEKFHFDSDCTLWHLELEKRFQGSKKIGDKVYFPQRKILPPEMIRAELEEAGFLIIDERVVGADSDTEFEAVCINFF